MSLSTMSHFLVVLGCFDIFGIFKENFGYSLDQRINRDLNVKFLGQGDCEGNIRLNTNSSIVSEKGFY